MQRALLVPAAATFSVGTDSFVVAGLLPQIADSLHVSTATGGQLVTAYALTYALGAPIDAVGDAASRAVARR